MTTNCPATSSCNCNADIGKLLANGQDRPKSKRKLVLTLFRSLMRHEVMADAGGCDSWPEIRIERSEGRIVIVTKAREESAFERGKTHAPYLRNVRQRVQSKDSYYRTVDKCKKLERPQTEGAKPAWPRISKKMPCKSAAIGLLRNLGFNMAEKARKTPASWSAIKTKNSELQSTQGKGRRCVRQRLG